MCRFADRAMVDIGAAHHTRKKRPHTRSKFGCSLCKRRRIRCDEQRPSCNNCAAWLAECVYPSRPPASLQAGTQVIWQLEKPLRGAAVDPFNSMPIDMPYKSHALLYHFSQVHDNLKKLLPADIKSTPLNFPSEDASIFRCMLLTAAAHYAAKSGGLHDYEQTFRFHMAHCVRMLHNCIGNEIGTSKISLLRCARFVTALCVIEVRIGNVDAATFHLNGLLAMIHFAESRAAESQRLNSAARISSVEVECLERFMIVADAFRSGLWDYHPALATSHRRSWPPQIHHTLYTEEWDQHLQALGLMSYLMTKLPHTLGPTVIDVTDLLPQTRQSIDASLKQRSQPTENWNYPSSNSMKSFHPDMISVPIANGASALLTWFGNILTPSLTEDSQATTHVITPALPFYLASGILFRRIMGIRPPNPKDVTEIRIQRRKFFVLYRGLQQSAADMRAGRLNHKVWFWEAFCALLGSKIFELQLGKHTPNLLPDYMFTELQCGLAEQARLWASRYNITTWQGARNVLLSVMWPHSVEHFPIETLAESLWDETIHS
ncbi:hypothetical protein GQ53DRAFT_803698 [Thozetella sp. PMI_491]|nr:hypothetical protein GQ53DRAFT_803698 [Thozetella sp. PMI_491]